jgi:RNA polymerase sigma-70 factor (ECF subfamily)
MPKSDLEQLKEWFEGRVTENYALFYSVAYQVLRNAHDAEEAAQDGVLKAWDDIASLENPAAVVGWVARIVRNTALDFKKKRRPELGHEATFAVTPARDSGGVHWDEREQLWDAVGRLPENQAVVITLRVKDGLGNGEIARRLGVSENVVRVRYHRGLENLRWWCSEAKSV